jgi:RimJ/RimL family protein N-acetyltransferase
VIALRAVEPADVEIFYEHQADPGAAQMAAFPSRDRAAHFDHWARRILGNPDGIVRTITVDGAVAGSVMSWLDADLGRLLGYWIGREYWGKGVATAAVSAYLNEVRERPILAYVAAHNVGSKRVLEKNGFKGATEQPEIGADGVTEFLYRLD